MYVFLLIPFMLQKQSWVVAEETVWLAKPFTEKFADHLLQQIADHKIKITSKKNHLGPFNFFFYQ